MKSWQVRSVVGEGVRNAASAGTSGLLLSIAVGVLLAAVAIEEGAALKLSAELQEDLRSAGSHVFIVEPSPSSEQAGFSAAECSSVIARPGVIRSGAILRSNFVSTTHVPNERFRLVVATAGAADVLLDGNSEIPVGQAMVSPDLAEHLGLNAGSYLSIANPTDGGQLVAVADVQRLDLRDQALSRSAMILGAPLGETEQCLIEVDEGFTRSTDLLATFSTPPRSITIRPFLPLGPFERSPEDEYATRIARLSWLAVGLVLAVLWTVILHSRRVELGLYASLNLRRSGRVLLVTAELWTLIVQGLAPALTAVLAFELLFDLPKEALGEMLNTLALALAWSLCTCSVAAWSTARGSVADQLKDR